MTKLGASYVVNEKIKKLEGQVHDLKLLKGELMNAKTAMTHERNANRQRVHELEGELKELKSNFVSLAECCQLAESSHDVKEREFSDAADKVPSLEAAVDEKEQDLKKALLECICLVQLLGLVINREGHFNPHLVSGIYKRFIQTTHIVNLVLSVDIDSCPKGHLGPCS